MEHGTTTRSDDGCFFLSRSRKVVVRVISRNACALRNVLLKTGKKKHKKIHVKTEKTNK